MPGRRSAGAPAVDPGEEKIIVFQRGPVGVSSHAAHEGCFFSEKIAAGQAAGYDVVIIANHHLGSNAGELPDAFLCEGQGNPVAGTAAGLSVGHRVYAPRLCADAGLHLPLPRAGAERAEARNARSRHRGFSPSSTARGCVRVLDGGSLTEIDELCLVERGEVLAGRWNCLTRDGNLGTPPPACERARRGLRAVARRAIGTGESEVLDRFGVERKDGPSRLGR